MTGADLKFKKFCPHCGNKSVQEYISHHVYDEKQGGMWDGEPETNQQPASYFTVYCQTCGQALLYHYYLTDSHEVEDFTSWTKTGGRREFGWDDDELVGGLELIWPGSGEEIHDYVPASVRKIYLKALRHASSPQLFALELRKAVEAVCDERGIRDKTEENKYRTLGERFGELCQIARLPPQVKDAGNKIIKSGNDAAHATVAPESAPLIRTFFRTLINHVYVLPLQLKEWESLD